MKKVSFVGFIVKPQGVAMEPGKTSYIIDWPKPKCHQNMQQFLDLANFYCRFIHGFLIISKPLISLLVGAKADKFSIPFVMTDKARRAFATLKRAFVTAFVTIISQDPSKPS